MSTVVASLGWRCPHLSDKDKEWEERRRRDRVIQMTEEVVEEKRMDKEPFLAILAYLLNPPLPCLCSHSLLLPLAFPCNPCHPWKTITLPWWPGWITNLTHHTVTATSSSQETNWFHSISASASALIIRTVTIKWNKRDGGERRGRQRGWVVIGLRLWSEMDGFSFTDNAVVNICINTLEWKIT